MLEINSNHPHLVYIVCYYGIRLLAVELASVRWQDLDTVSCQIAGCRNGMCQMVGCGGSLCQMVGYGDSQYRWLAVKIVCVRLLAVRIVTTK